MSIPEPAPFVIQRPALMTLLDRLERLVVVAAPAGFGKTSLVHTWTHRRSSLGDGVVWLRVAGGVDTPQALGHALFKQLVAGGFLDEASADPVHWDTWGRDAGWKTIETALVTRAAGARRLIIVIDRAERVRGDRWWDFLERLSRHAADVSVVALLRADGPSDQFPDAMGRDSRSLRIGARQLLFNTDEVSALATILGQQLSRSNAHRILDMTGGCPGLVHTVLTRLAASGKPTLDAAEVHQALDAQVGNGTDLLTSLRMFLPLALLDSFGVEEIGLCRQLGSLADAPPRSSAMDPVTPSGEHDVVRRLQNFGVLQAARVADGGDQARRWRFRPLFCAVLEEHLHCLHPLSVKQACRSFAAQAHATADPERRAEAARLARRGEDWPLLSEIWRAHLLRLQAGDLTRDFASSFWRLPPEATVAHPDLQEADELTRAAFTPDAPRLHRPTVGPAAEVTPETLCAITDPDEMLGVGTGALVAARVDGRLRRAASIAAMVKADLTRRRGVGMPRPGAVSTSWFQLQRGLTSCLVGDDVAAVAALGRAAINATAPDCDHVAAPAAALLELMHQRRASSPGKVARWRAQVEARYSSDHWLAPSVRLTRELSSLWRDTDDLALAPDLPLAWEGVGPDDGVDLYPFMVEATVRWHITYGDTAEALAWMEDLGLVPKTLSAGLKSVTPMVQRCYVDALISHGELNRAQAFMTAVSPDNSAVAPWLRVASARLELVLGRTEMALQLAEVEVRRPELSNRDRWELRLIEAAALAESGEHAKALEAFRRIRKTFTRLGLVHPYVTLPRPVLEKFSAELPAAAAAVWSVGPSWHPEEYRFVRLTEREKVVLEQLVTGTGPQQIAARLFVSPNTVKKQLVSLYSKLGVHTRPEALRLAYHLGLLEAPHR